MWFVPHNDPRPGGRASAVPDEDARALRAAWGGQGDRRQTSTAVRLVRDARRFHYWIACNCRAGEGVYPLMAPAWLSTAKVYYLRRLVGENRPEHAENCVFRFERPEPGFAPTDKRAPRPATPPAGFFSVLTSGHDAGLAENGARFRRDAGVKGPPPLARQLWRLMTEAGLTRLPPVQHSEKPSIRAEFEKIRSAAERLDVAPGTALARVLATHPSDYHSARLFARIRAAHKGGDDKAPLQGFLVVFARDVKGKALVFGEGEPVLIAGELARPMTGEAFLGGPWLALAVIGEHAQASGLTALRAYAQPVYSGAQFVPVESDFERRVLKAINAARWSLAKTHPVIEIAVEKPVFDPSGPEGLWRPDFVLDIVDGKTGESRTAFIDAVEPATVGALVAAGASFGSVGDIGAVLQIAADELADPRALARRIAEAVLVS